MTQTGHAGVVDSYELSPTQEGMLFHSLLGEATGVDLEQIVCTVRGAFDEHAFVAAFHEVATRHAILRTRFSHDGVGRPVQEVVETVAIPVERLDLAQRRVVRAPTPIRSIRRAGSSPWHRSWTRPGHAPAGRGVGRERASRRLDVPPRLARRALVPARTARGVGVLRGDARRQDARPAGAAAVPRIHRVPPRSRSQRRPRRTGATISRASPRPHRSPSTARRQTMQRPAGVQGVSERRLSPETTTALREFAASQDVTLNTLLQTAWAILLHRYSRETDIVFGATRACRHSAFPTPTRWSGCSSTRFRFA